MEKTLQTGIRDISSDTDSTKTSTSQKTGYKRSAEEEEEEEEELNMNRGNAKNSLLSEDIEGDSAEKRHKEAVIQVFTAMFVCRLVRVLF